MFSLVVDLFHLRYTKKFSVYTFQFSQPTTLSSWLHKTSCTCNNTPSPAPYLNWSTESNLGFSQSWSATHSFSFYFPKIPSGFENLTAKVMSRICLFLLLIMLSDLCLIFLIFFFAPYSRNIYLCKMKIISVHSLVTSPLFFNWIIPVFSTRLFCQLCLIICCHI